MLTNGSTFTSTAADFLFRPTEKRSLNLVFLAMLFAVGVAHWAMFFDFGRFRLTTYDWPDQHLYYSVVTQALAERTLPFHISVTFRDTNAFLAMPDAPISPQVALLPFMSIPQFILLNVCILYSIGFIGLLLLRKRYALSPLAFTMLFLLFNFNGHITSHLSVGHLWQGYFFLPFFCLFTLQLVEGRKDISVPVKLALTVAAILLQGSLHVAVWCLLFLGLIVIFCKGCRKGGLLAILFTGILGAIKFVPGALIFHGKGYTFIGGYRTLYDVFESFVRIHERGYSLLFGRGIRVMDWWEYDMFIGIVGLAAVVYLGLVVRWRHAWREALDRSGQTFRALDLPMLLMGLFSLSYFYAIFARLPVPLMNVERVTSRFILIPFLFLLVISCIRMQTALDRLASLGRVKWLVIPALIETAFSLMVHSLRWSVASIDAKATRPYDRFTEIAVSIVAQPAPAYKTAFTVSFVISFVGLLALTALLLLRKHHAHHRPDVPHS